MLCVLSVGFGFVNYRSYYTRLLDVEPQRNVVNSKNGENVCPYVLERVNFDLIPVAPTGTTVRQDD